MQTDRRPLKYPVMILDFIKELLSGFLLLLIVMSLAAIVVYRIEYVGQEKQAVTVTVDEELLNRVDDFQAENGLDSRAEAIRKLLDRALTEIEQSTSEKVSSETEIEQPTSEKGSPETEIEQSSPENSPSEGVLESN